MAFDLSTFTSALSTGGARPSLFELNITAPSSITGLDFNNVKYFCNVSALPPLTVTPIERQYFGRTVKFPGDMVFGDLSTTIMASQAGTERNSFESWMNAINGTNDNGLDAGLNSANGFGGTVTLIQYGKSSTTAIHTITFVDCWPTTVGEAPVSYDTASDILQFDVTWAYNYYTFV